MMRVKTILKESPISGIGLFADEDIPKEALVWEFDERFDQVYDDIPDGADELATSFVKMYGFRYGGKIIMCVDNARFFNHSSDPNCYSAEVPGKMGCTRAKRDIKKGEELTDNYNCFGVTAEDEEWNKLHSDEI